MEWLGTKPELGSAGGRWGVGPGMGRGWGRVPPVGVAERRMKMEMNPELRVNLTFKGEPQEENQGKRTPKGGLWVKGGERERD